MKTEIIQTKSMQVTPDPLPKRIPCPMRSNSGWLGGQYDFGDTPIGFDFGIPGLGFDVSDASHVEVSLIGRSISGSA